MTQEIECSLCGYKADTENELIGHLVADHNLPNQVSLKLAEQIVYEAGKEAPQ